MNEARSAARLNHEHIAQVYFAGQQDEIPFIAFEFVEGTNIRTIVENQGVFPLPQAITYLIQITHALDHAAFHGVIHRDVKPSNILITKEGRAKLIDMGLARLLKPTDPGDDLTASGVTLGTFDYISPEQARDPRNADIRSDIYSLGCTFFFMLAGRPPFNEGTVLQKLLQHQGDEPPDIRNFIPDAPPEISHILERMMAKDPRQRYQTPAALLAELTGIAGKLGMRPSGPGNAVWTMRPASKHASLLSHLPWMSGVVVFIASLIFLDWFWQKAEMQPPPITPTQVVQEPSTLPKMTSQTDPNGKQSSPTAPGTPPKGGAGRGSFVLRFWDGGDPGRPVGNAVAPSPGEKTASNRRSISVSGESRAALGVGVLRESFALRPVSLTTPISASLSATKSPTVAGSSNLNAMPGSALLVVDPTKVRPEEGIFSNLGAAIASAGKNATIELRFNGAANVKVEPMSLVGKQLTIQAGKGFAPILHFMPQDSSVVKEDGRIYLFLLSGGSLRFHKIGFEMDISPYIYAEKWSMFELLGPGQLSLTDCTITIRNTKPGSQDAFHEGASVFRIAQSVNAESNPSLSAAALSSARPSTTVARSENAETRPHEPVELLGRESLVPSHTLLPDRASDRTSDSPPMSGPATGSIAGMVEKEPGIAEKSDPLSSRITLNNCIVRGETTVLYVEANREVRLDANNAFFATDLPFVHLRDLPGLSRENERKATLSMQHVTIFCKSKLNRFVKKENSLPLPVKWILKYSAIRMNNTPINEFFGFLRPEEIASYSEWDGEYDFFQDVSSFAEIKASASVTHPPKISLDEWKNLWSIPPTINVDIFQLPLPENRTVNRLGPTDFLLSQRSVNPAFQKIPKSDADPQTKIDAGQILDSLPRLQSTSTP